MSARSAAAAPRYTGCLMRCIVTLQTCFALLLAFILAPFQHVHPGHGAGADSDHAGIIHAHFFSIPVAQEGSHAPGLTGPDDDDDHAAVWSVDSFTLVLTSGFAPFVPTRGPEIRVALSEVQQPITFIEERGHDPPYVHPSIPRAPPA